MSGTRRSSRLTAAAARAQAPAGQVRPVKPAVARARAPAGQVRPARPGVGESLQQRVSRDIVSWHLHLGIISAAVLASVLLLFQGPWASPPPSANPSQTRPSARFIEMCSIHLQWEAGAFGAERTLYEILVVKPPPVCSSSSSPPSSSSESSCLKPSPAELSDFFKALQLAYNVRSESIAFACQGNRGGRWDNIGGDELDAGSYADEECDICPQVAAGEQTVTRCAEAILITWSFRLLMDGPKRRVYDLEFLPGIEAVSGDAFGSEDWEVGTAWAKKLKVFCGMD